MAETSKGEIEFFGLISIRKFCRILKETMPFLEPMLSKFLRHKFLGEDITNYLPALIDRNSLILNQSMASMLCMTSERFRGVNNLPLLFNSKLDGRNWTDLTARVKYYEGPIIILVRHLVQYDNISEFHSSGLQNPTLSKFPVVSQLMAESGMNAEYQSHAKNIDANYNCWGRRNNHWENDTVNRLRNKYGVEGDLNDSIFNVLGAYVSTPLRDGFGWHGDDDTYLFSIMPYLRTFYADKEKHGKNYCKFNSKVDAKVRGGIGFGRASYGRSRLWVDQNLDACYICHEDDTFEDGWLTEKPTDKLKVESIEVLGAGHDWVYEQYIKWHRDGPLEHMTAPPVVIPERPVGQAYLDELEEKKVKAIPKPDNQFLDKEYKNRYLKEYLC
jgi:hypothetical protein